MREDILQRLLDMRDQGHLAFLFNNGFISSKILNEIDVAMEYDIQRRIGMKKMEARNYIATKFSIDQATVYRILKRVDYENWVNSTDKRG